jgi:ATP-binding cassette subfamily B protein
LLGNTREHWQAATLICVTHDVSDTQGFGRVLVVEDGRIVEDGTPQVLAARLDSRYRALLNAEAAVQKEFWESTDWRRLWLANGQLGEVR